MPGDKTYDGPERRQTPWTVKFDCEKDCPQHPRNDQRISDLEKRVDAAEKDRREMREKSEDRHSKVWAEIDEVKRDHDVDVRELKKDINDAQSDSNRRIGEKVPIKHAIAAVTVVMGIFVFIVKVNNDANNRVAEATAKTGQKIEEKLDALSTQVLTMKATNEAEKRSEGNNAALVIELRRMSDAMITAVERIADRTVDEEEKLKKRK